MKRAGIDPARFDRRPISEYLNDEIPYKRWEHEAALIKRAGYSGWQEVLQCRVKAKKKR